MGETVHGSAILAGANGVLIRGASGSGKSLLAAALIDRGARLISDDRVHLAACHGRILASAPAATAGLIELRGRGVVSVLHERSAVIRLVIDLVEAEELERMPEADQSCATILQVPLPRQAAPARSGHAVILAEAALRALTPHCRDLRSSRL